MNLFIVRLLFLFFYLKLSQKGQGIVIAFKTLFFFPITRRSAIHKDALRYFSGEKKEQISD